MNSREYAVRQDQLAEEWRPVPGFECFYEVSNFGNVRSYHFGEPRPKAGRLNNDGYPCFVFYGDGKRQTITLHRLVATVFHGEQPNAIHNEVAHLDGVRTNARADNLKWVSKTENHSHKRLHGTHGAGEKHPHAKLTEVAVAEIRSYPKGRIDLAAVARKFGVSPRTISSVRYGQNWKGVATNGAPIAIAVFAASWFIAALISGAGQ